MTLTGRGVSSPSVDRWEDVSHEADTLENIFRVVDRWKNISRNFDRQYDISLDVDSQEDVFMSSVTLTGRGKLSPATVTTYREEWWEGEEPVVESRDEASRPGVQLGQTSRGEAGREHRH